MAIIGKSAKRCFRKGPPAVPYFCQTNAWAHIVTFKKWFKTVFLPFIRKVTSEPVALVMDSCGPHGIDLMDHREQVEILTLPPNCTAKFQPMDMGVIASFNLRYRRLLLARITANIEERDALRAAAKHMKAGMRGLDEGHDPHMLDVADLVKQAWEEVSEKTIARCWIKADILPRAIQGALEGVFGKIERFKTMDEEYDAQLAEIVKGLRNLKLSVTPYSHLSNRLSDYSVDVVEDWICVESTEAMQNALVEEVFENIENSFVSQKRGDSEHTGDEFSDVEEADSTIGKQIKSALEISNAFKEVELYVEDVGHTVACDAIRRAKKALLNSFHMQNKKNQTDFDG